MADRRPVVRVIAPARWAPAEVLTSFAEIAEPQGLSVQIDPQAMIEWRQLAGGDGVRAEALARALQDPDVDIIWCARGGYGCTRTLAQMAEMPVSGSKLLIGYSDITALQLSEVFSGLRSIHGPMPVDVTKPGGPERIALTAARARQMVLGEVSSLPSVTLFPGRAGQVTAPLAIGNLAVLTTLLGTRYEPSFHKVILCLEDISEYFYALDRHFVHLAQSRLAPAIAGIVLGDFTELEDNEIPWGETVLEMALRHFPGIPIASDLPIGHAENNEPFVQRAMAKLHVSSESAELKFIE